jgi:hypothetical protein
VPVLQVNQNGKDQEHDRAGQNSLFVHEVEETRRNARNAKRETAVSKVNDQAEGVKPWEH